MGRDLGVLLEPRGLLAVALFWLPLGRLDFVKCLSAENREGLFLTCSELTCFHQEAGVGAILSSPAYCSFKRKQRRMKLEEGWGDPEYSQEVPSMNGLPVERLAGLGPESTGPRTTTVERTVNS